MNALHFACLMSESDTLDWLLNVCLNNEDAIRLLKQKATAEQETPLMMASKMGNTECTKEILAYLKQNNQLDREFLNA